MINIAVLSIAVLQTILIFLGSNGRIVSTGLLAQPRRFQRFGDKSDFKKGRSHPPSLPAEQRILRTDQRLANLVTVIDRNPSLEEVLRRLEQSTMLSFRVDPSLAGHDPNFGSVTFRNVPAWTVMDLVARTGLRGGRWVREPSGYRLVGVPTGPNRPDDVAAAGPKSGPPPTKWLLLGAVVLGGLAVFFLGLRTLRNSHPLRCRSADSSARRDDCGTPPS